MNRDRGWYRLVCVALALVLISTLMLSASCGGEGGKGGEGTPNASAPKETGAITIKGEDTQKTIPIHA